MKTSIFTFLLILLLACNPSNNSSTLVGSSDSKDKTIEKKDSIDIKTLFRLSPLSIFDETTEGLDLAEKNDLLEKGESASWKIIDQSNTKISIQCKYPSSEVTLSFLANKDNRDGLLFAEIMNEQNASLLSWKYSNTDQSLQKVEVLKKYQANDFVSEEDQLPDSYSPILHYQFIDDRTIEVSLNTWMQEEFENREIVNSIFLIWNGESFEEKIVKKEKAQGGYPFQLLDKPTYELSKLKHEGEIIHDRIWQDANGENIALFTLNKEELFVYHYAIKADQVELMRKVYDSEKDCDFDLFLEFIDNSIEVTDLDNNNIGELTFAYKKACISDVSPKNLNLLVLENGNKFTIRGYTGIDMPGVKVDVTKKVDGSFNNAPASFLSHAVNIWDKIKQE